MTAGDMSRSMKAITYVPLKQWLTIEMAALTVLSLLSLLESRLAGYSAFIGGLIFIITNADFAHRTYRYHAPTQMHLAGRNRVRAERIKLPLAPGFFAAVSPLREPVHVPALLFTFAVMVVLGTALRWLIRPRPQR